MESTNNQMHKEMALKIKPIQSLGIRIRPQINFKIRKILNEGGFNAPIVDFKKSWFIVSQRLVSAIKKRIKNKCGCILRNPLFAA